MNHRATKTGNENRRRILRDINGVGHRINNDIKELHEVSDNRPDRVVKVMADFVEKYTGHFSTRQPRLREQRLICVDVKRHYMVLIIKSVGVCPICKTGISSVKKPRSRPCARTLRTHPETGSIRPVDTAAFNTENVAKSFLEGLLFRAILKVNIRIRNDKIVNLIHRLLDLLNGLSSEICLIEGKHRCRLFECHDAARTVFQKFHRFQTLLTTSNGTELSNRQWHILTHLSNR